MSFIRGFTVCNACVLTIFEGASQHIFRFCSWNYLFPHYWPIACKHSLGGFSVWRKQQKILRMFYSFIHFYYTAYQFKIHTNAHKHTNTHKLTNQKLTLVIWPIWITFNSSPDAKEIYLFLTRLFSIHGGIFWKFYCTLTQLLTQYL